MKKVRKKRLGKKAVEGVAVFERGAEAADWLAEKARAIHHLGEEIRWINVAGRFRRLADGKRN